MPGSLSPRSVSHTARSNINLALSSVAVTKGQISTGSSTSPTAGRYRCYTLLFVTTANLTADTPHTKGEESSVSFFIGTQKNAVKMCRALVWYIVGWSRDRFPVVSLGIFSVVPPTEPCALRSTQPLKVSTRDFSWGKGGR